MHVANGDDVGVLAVTNTKAFSPMINLLDHATAQDNGQPVVDHDASERYVVYASCKNAT